MNEINTAFIRLSQILPTMHILFAVFVIALQVAVVLCCEMFVRLPHSEHSRAVFIKMLKYFCLAFGAVMVLSAISGALQVGTARLRYLDPMSESALMTKFTLFAFFFINLGYIAYRIFLIGRAARACDAGASDDALIDSVIIIGRYFVPLNIVVCIIAIYIGVAIRGLA